MEKRTSYAYSVKNLAEPSFDQIHALSRKYIMSLSQELQNELFDELNHGVELIDSEPLMQEYLFSFGQMHRAKLRLAFEHIDKEVWAHESLSIIDYGCGQGIATMCLVDYLREKGFDVSRIRSVRLIEPSALCLDRAELHVHQFLPDAKITPIPKFLNDLTAQDVASDGACALHLFSNILDIEAVDLDLLTSLLNGVDYPAAEFICVDPLFKQKERDARIDYFCNNLFDATRIYSLSKAKGEWKNMWSCVVRILSKIKTDKNADDTIFQLAEDYYMGRNGLSRNYEKAAEIYLNLAQKNHKKAQYRLGYFYYRGLFFKRDDREAVKWYRLSAEQGYAEAQLSLGCIYMNGRNGVEQNISEALKWIRLSALRGYAEAQYYLGEYYRRGDVVCQNYAEAFKWFNLSAEKGYFSGMQALVDCYTNGWGVEKDLKMAKKWRNLSNGRPEDYDENIDLFKLFACVKQPI